MESEYPYRPQAVFEAVCTGGSWVFGCLTALGRIPRLRQPKVRVFAAAITAATQALTFRDVQVTRQRSIQRLLDDRDARLGAWEHTKRVVSVRNSERHDSNFPESFEVWDTKHGKDMLTKHKLRFYSSEAILFKSMVFGMTLGTAWPLINTYLCYYLWAKGMLTNNFCFYVRPDGKRMPFQIHNHLQRYSEPDYSLNRLYAVCLGSFAAPNIQNENDALVVMAVPCGDELCFLEAILYAILCWSLSEWRASPYCWYSRKGKLPVFQFRVDEEKGPESSPLLALP